LGRRELKKEVTRQDILSAASELFRTKGYEATSVDDIALAANVAKGTFYYHFQAKEDLVLALQEAELKKAAENAKERLASDMPRLQILFDFLSEVAHWTEVNADLARVIFKQKFATQSQSSSKAGCNNEPGPPPSIKKYFFDSIVQLLTAAQQNGEIRKDIDASEMARIVIPVVMMSVRMSWHKDAGKESLSVRLERLLKLVMEGLKPA
jgi:AcrR family transcriptional regulator